MKATTLISLLFAALASASTQTTTIMATQTTTVIYTVMDAHPTSMSMYPQSMSSVVSSYTVSNGTASAAPSGSAPVASASTVASATTPGSTIQPSIKPVTGSASTIGASFGLVAAAAVAAAFL